MSVRTGTPRGSIFSRLYRGETNIDFIGRRKRWYLASAVIILVCLASMIFRGFNFGIEFAGGNQYQAPVKPGTSLAEVRSAVEAQGVAISSAQTAGSGTTRQYVIRTGKQGNAQQDAAQIQQVKVAIARVDKINASDVNTSEVSSSWGSEVTTQAVRALIVFLLAVSVFMWIRFKEIKVAGAAVLALLHDLILTAGVYSIVGFQVTPGTVVGLLTILGYSLYDTVVVFDKVDENTRGLLGTTRWTYGEAANLAVNQTLMRSINTSLIGLLPVAGLLFVGAGLLGVGTLEDLALVLFVGMITGAYSSLFLATPWLVDFKMLDPKYRNHARRILTRRAAETGKGKGAAEARTLGADGALDEDESEDAELVDAGAGARVGAKPAAAKATGA
ncbi:MAG TPA: protein translocase subunit SecF, partial [Rugosimonospora sp.]|nr:protein translocase subunit SecF [Rugosimonospora sp.]